MSKFINITVSASLSTDFYLEVPDDMTKDQIELLAKKEIVLPNEYPKIIDNFLKTRMNLEIKGIDSLLKNWNIDDIAYIIDDND